MNHERQEIFRTSPISVGQEAMTTRTWIEEIIFRHNLKIEVVMTLGLPVDFIFNGRLQIIDIREEQK